MSDMSGTQDLGRGLDFKYGPESFIHGIDYKYTDTTSYELASKVHGQRHSMMEWI